MEITGTAEVIRELCERMVSQKASDLFLSVGFPPALKIDGKVMPAASQPLSEAHVRSFARVLMNERQLGIFEATKECNFAHVQPGVGRFRVNACLDQNGTALVLRTINTVIPTMEELGLPAVLREVAMSPRGLVMLVGGTGTGKSTSLAAMIGYRNQHSHGHIITIEDPVEFVHGHGNCIVTQREVGVTTESWQAALENTLRQAPDVIMIGEIRDREGMQHAISFAETGHLCFATLHATNANEALDRIINFFPDDRRQQLLMDLSLNVRAFISQRLIPRESARGRVAAFEIMLDSPLVKDLIFKGDVGHLKEVMTHSEEIGMQTFDKAVFDLYQADMISYEDALRFADSHNDLRLRIKLEPNGRKPFDQDGAVSMSIV